MLFRSQGLRPCYPRHRRSRHVTSTRSLYYAWVLSSASWAEKPSGYRCVYSTGSNLAANRWNSKRPIRFARRRSVNTAILQRPVDAKSSASPGPSSGTTTAIIRESRNVHKRAVFRREICTACLGIKCPQQLFVTDDLHRHGYDILTTRV